MKIIFIIVVVIFVFCPQVKTQQNRFDIVYHKYLGRLEGNVIQIKEQSVEFRLAKTNLLYDYPKEELRYIIMKDGDWVSITENNVDDDFKTFGSCLISCGGIINIGKGILQNQRNIGYQFQSELSYNVNKNYSIGLLLGYSIIETDEKKLLVNNNYLMSNSTASAGNVYHLRVGLNNHLKFLPSLLFVPEINLYAGYSNQIMSESTIISSSVVNKIPDRIEKGIELGAGIGLLIKTRRSAGIIITFQYSRIFQLNGKVEFLYANLGYRFSID